MDSLLLIIAFVVFAVVLNAFDKKKPPAKRVPIPVPPPAQRPDVRCPATIAVPEASPTAAEPAAVNSYAAYLARKAAEKADAVQRPQEVSPPMAAEQKRRPADIHTNVILNAVAYAEILDKPKAYQRRGYRSFRFR